MSKIDESYFGLSSLADAFLDRAEIKLIHSGKCPQCANEPLKNTISNEEFNGFQCDKCFAIYLLEPNQPV